MVTEMRTLFGPVFIAASVWAAALTLPATAHARDITNATTASSGVVASRADSVTASSKRARRASTQPIRRVASVASAAPYHSRCFLFWCSAGGGRTFNALMLGIGY